MADRSVVFEWSDCDAWRDALGFEWEKLLELAQIGKTQRYVVKDRWGDNPHQMDKLFEALKRTELKRTKRTPVGERMLALEEWIDLGRTISADPDVMSAELERVRQTAAGVSKIVASKKLEAEGRALLSITPEPKKPRK